MRNFFSNLRYKFSQWMQGRYGTDELNRFLSIAALILIIAGLFRSFWAPFKYFYYVGVILLIFEIFRSLSKNSAARLKERDRFLAIKKKFTSFLSLQKRRAAEGNEYCFFKCPCCKATVRVPRGKGRIQITCPKCRTDFIKRT